MKNAVLSKLKFNGPDALALAGVAILSYGCWLISEPAGFIAAGICLILLAFTAMRGS